MANMIVDRLRAKDKKGLFLATQTSVSYPTGFDVFDYRNGYMVQVRDLYEKFICEYKSNGIVGGTFITIVGKTSTAKTTFAAQIAANIVRPYENAFVQHYDLEQALTYTRIKNITGFTHAELDDKYILKQEKNYIEDIFDAIVLVGKEKEENKKEYIYDTGVRDEFNRPIKAYAPTVMIIDSIPTLASKDASDAMEGGTYSNRVAKALAQFYKRLMPIIKTYNITVIAINHINAKIEINPMMKSQPQMLYMKMDETIPGGNAPIYFAHNLLKFVGVGASKFTQVDDGFDGFLIRCELLKSRTNKAGQFCNLVYNQVNGFDPITTQFQFAKDNGLINGNRPNNYLTDFKDVKFDWKNFRKEYLTNDKLRYAMFDKTLPILDAQLSRVDPDFNDFSKALKHIDVLDRLAASQEGEVFDAA